ncbi:MAG: hypothetical protein HYR84_02115 [Planctomycetes bacterium]|nr:hypothetical protein [Planctomycetota bacterium]
MAVVDNPSQAHTANGDAEIQRLESVVRDLQGECEKLREALATAQAERDSYRQLFLQEARERREFEDLDIPTLESMSAGPVEEL